MVTEWLTFCRFNGGNENNCKSRRQYIETNNAQNGLNRTVKEILVTHVRSVFIYCHLYLALTPLSFDNYQRNLDQRSVKKRKPWVVNCFHKNLTWPLQSWQVCSMRKDDEHSIVNRFLSVNLNFSCGII